MITNLPQSLATDSSESSFPASSSDTQATKKNRRQRQKAAKAKAAQHSKHADTIEADQSMTMTPVDKAERSLASLTIAEVKALKLEESLKKHNAQNPPKAATAPKKNQKPNPPAKATTTAQANKNAAPKKDEHATPSAKAATAAKAKQPVQYPAQRNTTISMPGIEQPPDLLFQRLPPCGIRNCPVLAPHERRPYVFDEPDRPNWVKNIQDKGDAATGNEWDNVDRFFILHSFIKN